MRSILAVLVNLSMVAASVLGILMHKPRYLLCWYLIISGIVLAVGGNIAEAIYESFLQTQTSHHSIVDVLYFTSFTIFVAALLIVGKGRANFYWVNLIDPLIVGLGTGMLSWVFLIQPQLNNLTFLPLEHLFWVYLILYLVMLTLLVQLFFVPAKRGPTLYFFCGSLLVALITDSVCQALPNEPDGLLYGGLIISSILAGTAMLHPSMASLSEPVDEASSRLTWWRLVLLTSAMLMAPSVLAIQAVIGQPINVVLIVGGSAILFLLVAARLGFMIQERKVLERRLEFQATHDPLTKLPNRTLFTDRFEQALARSIRQGSKVAILFLDLDNFKDINDSLGHEVGDKVLTVVSHRLTSCLRPTDTAARLGGDEFTIILEDVEHEQGAVDVAKRIMKELQEPITLGTTEGVVSCSIGIVLSSNTEDRLANLLRKADLALYQAKSGGKSGYVVFTSRLEDEFAS